MKNETPTVFVIDDDDAVRSSLRLLLKSYGLDAQLCASAEEFLANHDADRPGCVVLDVRMPGLSGLALFERLLQLPWQAAVPVIFLSGHADVPTAVDAVKRGAFDFCEKPFSDNALVDRVEQALDRSAEVLAQQRVKRELQQRLDSLTDRERDVMDLVIAGLPNKLVADQLNISVRTVEVHRSRVFDKMGVKSAVELANVLRPT